MKTVRIRLSSNYATPTAAGAPGDELSLPRDVAEDLIEKGYATKVSGGHRSTPAAAAATPSDEKAPSGNMKKVLAWVGDDLGRAATALEQELARAKTRISLVEILDVMILAGAEEEE
jgi:hypothetical protein